jgi:hypothetical protein
MERPMEQKKHDEFAALMNRFKEEKEFRQLVIKLSYLNKEQLEGLMKLMGIPLD